MPPRLITIPFSHYCEKARWALDRCGVGYVEDGHLPIFHYAATRRVGGRSVPVLVDGDTVLTDSTEIVAWAIARSPDALASSPKALELEDDFDRVLGPATRRWAYFELLPRPDIGRFMTRATPRWEAAMLRVTRPLAVAFLRRGLRIDAAGAERSRLRIADTFARVGELLADGRRFLVGDRFSVADLTFAALAAPVLGPPGHPIEMPELTGAAVVQANAWRASPAGRFALQLYAEERAVRPRAA